MYFDDLLMEEVFAQSIARRKDPIWSGDSESFDATAMLSAAEIEGRSRPLSAVSAQSSRTVDMANKESARITIKLSVACDPANRWPTLDDATAYVDALLTAEVQAVRTRNKTREGVPNPFSNEKNPLVAISFEYGLTLNLGNYNFAKPSAGAQLVTTPENLAHVIADLRENLKAAMGKAVAKARGK